MEGIRSLYTYIYNTDVAVVLYQTERHMSYQTVAMSHIFNDLKMPGS